MITSVFLALHERQVLKSKFPQRNREHVPQPYTSNFNGPNSILKCIFSFKEKITTGCQPRVEFMDLGTWYKIVMEMNRS